MLKKMLTVDPRQRVTAAQARQHAWFALDKRAAEEPIPESVMENVRGFRGRSRLKRAALNILVKMINPGEFVALRKVFNKIDRDMSGTIEVRELQEALREESVDREQISQEEVERIIR